MSMEAEKKFRQWVIRVGLEWGPRPMLELFRLKMFGVKLMPVQMIRSQSCSGEWAGENVCHLQDGWLPYHEMPRVIGGLQERG